ncbi:MAG: type II TA system antitoxin MqsA family protein [Candidatus Paceibacterota bacterium]
MANKPFPWMCGECGRTGVRPKAIEYKGEIKHDGKLYEVCVDNLEVPTCGHCGEQWFDIETDKQINAALRRTIGLLQPEEIRKRRKALDLTQKDLAEKIGVAVASLSRWENGSSIQARSTDKLLRMYFRHPEDPVWSGEDGTDEQPIVSPLELGRRLSEGRQVSPHWALNPLEETLLGRLLLRPSELKSVSELVRSRDFSNKTCRHIYEAMLSCLREHREARADHFFVCVRNRLANVEPRSIAFLPLFVDHVRPTDDAADIAIMLRNRAMIHEQIVPTDDELSDVQ